MDEDERKAWHERERRILVNGLALIRRALRQVSDEFDQALGDDDPGPEPAPDESTRIARCSTVLTTLHNAMVRPNARFDRWLDQASLELYEPRSDDFRAQLLFDLHEYVGSGDVAGLRAKLMRRSELNLTDEQITTALRRLRTHRNVPAVAARLTLRAGFDQRAVGESAEHAIARIAKAFREAAKRAAKHT